jgi:hypothetical protein
MSAALSQDSGATADLRISGFDDLLRIARRQTEPQRLLFVFAGADLPDDCTPAQRAGFEAGQGGALLPLMSVSKAPDDLSSFAGLVAESSQFGRDWAVVFVAALSGRGGRAPSDADTGRVLDQMTESVRSGAFGAFMPFDQSGNPLLID